MTPIVTISSGMDEREIRAIRTFLTVGHEAGAPFDLGAPPHALPVRARDGAVDEEVTATVVAVLVNLVVARRVLLLRRPVHRTDDAHLSLIGTSKIALSTHGRNHAPRSASVPFCFHARK